MAVSIVEQLQLEARDGSVTIFDTTAGPNNVNLTRPRDPLDPEATTGGRGADGLWDGFTGDGYLDMGGNAGDAFSFNVVAPQDDTYTVTFRYSSPSNRPMTFSVDGVSSATLAFDSTGSFDTWVDTSVTLALSAGTHTIRLANVGNAGPDLDRVTVTYEVPDGPDVTADENDDLSLSVISTGNRSAVLFAVAGIDDDINTTMVSIAGGAPQSVVLDASGRFSLDLSALTGSFDVTLTVADEVPNTASASTNLSLPPIGITHLFFDGNAFNNLNPTQTIIRDTAVPSSYEPNSTNDKDGDGLNDNHDGSSYLDFGGGVGDKGALTVTVDEAGTYDFVVRMANGNATQLRPISIRTGDQTISIADTRTGSLTTWQDFHVQLDLQAGSNNVIFRQTNSQGGPNIDSVTVTSLFDPDYTPVNGSARLELEQTADHSTRILSADEAEFYFTVGSDGLYALDLAANAGANGGEISYYLTADEGTRTLVKTTSFPGQGTTGEVHAYAQLDQGVHYKLTAQSASAGAGDLDYLDVRQVGDANADISVDSRDAAYFDDRLIFNWLENPVARDESPRQYKTTGTVRITNTGSSPLEILDTSIDKFYSIVTPNVVGQKIAAGSFLDIQVRFNGDADAPNSFPAVEKRTIYEGNLVLTTNDAEDPQARIKLAAIWQSQAENSNEPNINDVWRAFGFSNHVTIAALNNYGIYEKVSNDEILSPTWRVADDATEVRVTQLAAYHGPGGGPIAIHAPGNKGASVALFNGNSVWNQSVLPQKNGGGFATTTFTKATVPDQWAGDDTFSFSVSSFSTNPKLNPIDPTHIAGTQQGYYTRVFQALDGDGNVIHNTYLAVQDYVGINYDYNDNMILIQGVTPVDPLI